MLRFEASLPSLLLQESFFLCTPVVAQNHVFTGCRTQDIQVVSLTLRHSPTYPQSCSLQQLIFPSFPPGFHRFSSQTQLSSLLWPPQHPSSLSPFLRVHLPIPRKKFCSGPITATPWRVSELHTMQPVASTFFQDQERQQKPRSEKSA